MPRKSNVTQEFDINNVVIVPNSAGDNVLNLNIATNPPT